MRKSTVGTSGIASALAAAMVAAVIFCAQSEAKLLKVMAQSSSKFEQAELLSAERPKIPAEMQEEEYKSFCIAKFIINPDGKTCVSLVTSSGSADIDELTLDTLRGWKFKPAKLDGKPISSTRKIKIEFEVQ